MMHQFTMLPSVGDYTLLKPSQCQDVSTQIILFFFSLSFLRRDEDYVAVYLKKNLYLSFSHKYILKIIHFFLFSTCFYGVDRVFGSD